MTFYNRILKRVRCLLFLFACFYFSGCANNVPDNSDAELYNRANYDLDKGYFTAAIQKLKSIETRFPFGIFSVQSRLDLIYAYFCSKSYQLCHAAANMFIRMHPNHLNVDYCYYMRALASNAIHVSGSKVSLNLSARAAGDAKIAFQEFHEFLDLFPNSKYAADARQRMIAIKNNLARHELLIGRYYLDKGAYIAAANRAQNIISAFQGSPVTADALALAVECYRRLHLKNDANKVLNLLKVNFPDHYTLKKGSFNYTYKEIKSKKTLLEQQQLRIKRTKLLKFE